MHMHMHICTCQMHMHMHMYMHMYMHMHTLMLMHMHMHMLHVHVHVHARHMYMHTLSVAWDTQDRNLWTVFRGLFSCSVQHLYEADKMGVLNATATYHKLAEGVEVDLGPPPVDGSPKLVCALRANKSHFYLFGPTSSTWKKAAAKHGAQVATRIGRSDGDHDREEVRRRLATAAAVEGLDPNSESFLNEVLNRVLPSSWMVIQGLKSPKQAEFTFKPL